MSGPREIAPHLLSWASDLDAGTAEQAARSARLPFVAGHVALMPDAHYGKGATIGSVIPTAGAVIPAAVGVDIGCGMVACETNLTASDLPDNLDRLMPLIEARIPAGLGRGHATETWEAGSRHDVDLADTFTDGGPDLSPFSIEETDVIHRQFGTLGSGNHFVEVCLDERDRVWVVLHSGSRGIGNKLARHHIDKAKHLAKAWFLPLEDPDLAYLVQGTPEFDAYLRDVTWAQRYAMASRRRMAGAAVVSLVEVVGHGRTVRVINCHHNYVTAERHYGRNLWITRKGAIRARAGDLGVIPGSMGTSSYIVEGLGSRASYESCSHGAGRRMSRTEATRTLTVDSLTAAMAGRTWNADKALALLDEHPASYKDIDRVMADQADLVTILHTLTACFNYKGA